jgi:glycosyltransferase involved in cell wall biosynthesis
VSLPTVSIVVPALNEAPRVGRVLEALLHQTYPKELLEIAVVDNGSADETLSIASRYPVRVLETRGEANAERARNLGIARTSGEIVAFTDADCVPAPDWIEAAVRTMEKSGAQLVAGRVKFEVAERPSCAELFDSIANLQNQVSVPARAVAYTANLFVRRGALETLGNFPANAIGGGDTLLCVKAARAGFQLVYEKSAIVSHPTRRFRALMKKAYRIGREKGAARALGHPFLGGGRGPGGLRRLLALPHVRALNPAAAARALRAENRKFSPCSLLGIQAVALSYLLVCAVGIKRGRRLNRQGLPIKIRPLQTEA